MTKREDSLLGDHSTAVNVDSYGRVTIPKGLREVLDIQEDLGSDRTDLLKVVFENPAEDKRASSFLEISCDGRVTIPEGVREYLEVEEGSLLKIDIEYPAEPSEDQE